MGRSKEGTIKYVLETQINMNLQKLTGTQDNSIGQAQIRMHVNSARDRRRCPIAAIRIDIKNPMPPMYQRLLIDTVIYRQQFNL